MKIVLDNGTKQQYFISSNLIINKALSTKRSLSPVRCLIIVSSSPLTNSPLTPVTHLYIGPHDPVLIVKDSAIPGGSYMVSFRVATIMEQ